MQRLSQEEGINLAGIKRILALQDEVASLREQLGAVHEAIEEMAARSGGRVFSADRSGRVTSLRRGERPERPPGGALVLWRPDRRR